MEALQSKLRRKDEVISEIMEDLVREKKSQWGDLKSRWVPHDHRDSIIDFIRKYSQLTELATSSLLAWCGLSTRKFARWRTRYVKANEHNALVPRDHWLEPAEREAIIAFAREYHWRATADSPS